MENLFCNKNLFFRKFFLLIIFFIPLIFWSLKETYLLGSDFGTYYAGSFFISDDYQLYKDFFEHKGPIYYLFIKTIGSFIGWGLNQAALTLFFSILVFYIPIVHSIFKYCKSNISTLAMLLLSIALLNFQSSNSSIAFFQEGLLIISFIPILEKNYEIKKYITVILFFWLAVFTRFDSIVFLPLIFFYLLKVCQRKKFFKKLIIAFLIFILPILIFIYLSNLYDFTLQELISHNIGFNNWYKNNYFLSSSNYFLKFIKYLDKPRALILSIQSLITPLLILIIYKNINFSKFFKNLNFQIYKIFSAKNFHKIKEVNPSLLIVLISLFAFFFSNSDRDYHSLIFMCPLSLLIIINYEKVIKNNKYLPFLLSIYLFVPYFIVFSTSYFQIYKSQQSMPPYSETINFLNKTKIEPEIIGGSGWLYFLSEQKPKRAINDWWLYRLEKPYISESLVDQHKKLLKRESGYIFWINNYLLKTQTENKLLNEIKSISEPIEDQGYYTMYKVK